jgi:predicted phage-related endonuclease
MAGDWHVLWLEKTGKAAQEDLSGNLAVIMGTFTEPLNRAWFTKQTGVAVNVVPEPRVHPTLKFMRANLDGLCPQAAAVFEAKHVNAYTKDEELVSRYYPQCQHLMAVTDFPMVYLSAFFGNAKWVYFEVARDEDYIADLTKRETEFWGYVERNEPPPSVEAAAAVAVSFDDMREVDLSQNNAWCAFAADWLANGEAAKRFETAKKELTALVEPDVKKAFGAGIVASRSKAGAVTIKQEKK